VGWSDVESCKACGAPLGQYPSGYGQPATPRNSWNEPEGESKGLAILSLVLGIISFFTLGLLGVGAIIGIIVAVAAMRRVKREPWNYGGRSIAVAGLVLSIVSLASVIPVGIIAAIAIPNLLASRIAANEGSAVRSLNTIASAETVHQSMTGNYGTLEELCAQGLIDPVLAKGVKSGYRFTLELTDHGGEIPGFEVVGVPLTYRSSGMRSFYVDETSVLRGADNHGGPSSAQDDPLATGPMRREIRYNSPQNF